VLLVLLVLVVLVVLLLLLLLYGQHLLGLLLVLLVLHYGHLLHVQLLRHAPCAHLLLPDDAMRGHHARRYSRLHVHGLLPAASGRGGARHAARQRDAGAAGKRDSDLWQLLPRLLLRCRCGRLLRRVLAVQLLLRVVRVVPVGRRGLLKLHVAAAGVLQQHLLLVLRRLALLPRGGHHAGRLRLLLVLMMLLLRVGGGAGAAGSRVGAVGTRLEPMLDPLLLGELLVLLLLVLLLLVVLARRLLLQARLHLLDAARPVAASRRHLEVDHATLLLLLLPIGCDGDKPVPARDGSAASLRVLRLLGRQQGP
jgi:hypothetical protein